MCILGVWCLVFRVSCFVPAHRPPPTKHQTPTPKPKPHPTGYKDSMTLADALAALPRDPAAPLDLATLALHLARDEYPDLDVEAYLGELAALAREARPYLHGSLAA